MFIIVPVLGEARTCLAARYPVGLADRFGCLAERPGGRDLWGLGRGSETLEDRAGTVEDHMDLADGRPSP